MIKKMNEETVLDQDPRTALIEELLQNIVPYREIILIRADEMVTDIYLRDLTPGSEFTLYGSIHIPPRYQFPVNYVLPRIKEIGETLNLPLLEIEYIDPHDIDADFGRYPRIRATGFSEPQLIISRTYSQQPKRTRELLAKNARNAGINIYTFSTNEIDIKPFKDYFFKSTNIFDPEAVIEMVKAVQRRPQGLKEPLYFYALSKIPTIPEMLTALKGKSAMANFLIKLYTSSCATNSERENQILSHEIMRIWFRFFYPYGI